MGRWAVREGRERAGGKRKVGERWRVGCREGVGRAGGEKGRGPSEGESKRGEKEKRKGGRVERGSQSTQQPQSPAPFPDITWLQRLTRQARRWLLFTTSSSLPPFKNPQVP